ncbi:MAG: hypothetical protein AB1394_06515 [Bacteroidota bacterium]
MAPAKKYSEPDNAEICAASIKVKARLPETFYSKKQNLNLMLTLNFIRGFYD